MAIKNKLKNPVFIITVSFYIFLFLIPVFVQQTVTGADVYTSFFFNKNLNSVLCLVPAALGIFFAKKDIGSNTVLAVTDTFILLLIFFEFFVSANYHLNLLISIFIFIFILININELFSVLGVIPFFFLSELDIFHYVITVAIPLIFLLIIELPLTENKIKKMAMKITLFVQCYICVFFAVLLATDLYWIYINSSIPQYVTAEYIIKTAAMIILMLFVTVCYVINIFRHTQKTSEKLIFSAPVIVFTVLAIAGYFTDIFSTVNRTSVLINLIYIVLFNTQNKTDQKINGTFTAVSALLFSLSMI